MSHLLWSIMPGKIRYLIYFYYFTFNNLWHFLFIFDRWKQSLTSYCVHHRSPPCSQLDRNTASLSKSISCSFSSILGRRNWDFFGGEGSLGASPPPYTHSASIWWRFWMQSVEVATKNLTFLKSMPWKLSSRSISYAILSWLVAILTDRTCYIVF